MFAFSKELGTTCSEFQCGFVLRTRACGSALGPLKIHKYIHEKWDLIRTYMRTYLIEQGWSSMEPDPARVSA